MKKIRGALRARWLFPILLLGLAAAAVIQSPVSASKQNVSTSQAPARTDITQPEAQPVEVEETAPKDEVLPAAADPETGSQAQLDTTQCGTY